ncbi:MULTISPECIES: condensin complex protein MksE [Aeromonas]|jgi:hypothetical protein|uniref:Uncharacterized protein n=1 Tax=Aeromonas caviae TaxID=648 RepID=A0AAI9P9B3_AERCA|nr:MULTISPECIES: hypothetical protein [Aeromonas]EJN6954306.1 hypothetical protein [Aeromonas hydrophila]KER62497.1 hypothetical protein HR52_05460 [Aeromonas hydrophila]MBS4726511.1 hypothetical protein [Aeromonas veronii]OCA67586.1 hypothetical protein A9R12_02810 [Aeromonas hydrophila]RSM22024.1 hypothetical protein C5B78_21685 [Aeromonas salmonicida]
MYNAALSSDIFNDLMNGKMINKTTFNNAGQFVDNELFIEIITNLKDYRTQYEMNGFEFVETNNYFFIRDRVNNKDDLKTDISMRACLMLLLLGKYITENNYRLEKLTDAAGGITVADIEAIKEMSDTGEILEKAGINKDLHKEIRTTLVNRNIMLEKPSQQVYVLSDSGRAFFDEIIANYTA